MRLTTHTDYSLRLLLYLAAAPNSFATVGEVATAYAISRNHLVKVAGALSHLGYVDTVRGRSGGIRLARVPSQIRLGEVVREMEPDFDLVECFHSASNACVITRDCSLKGPLYAARTAFIAALDEYSLADLLKHPTLGAHLVHLGGREGKAAKPSRRKNP